MPVHNRGDDEMVDVRLRMTEEQVRLLEALAADGGPFDDPNEALRYVIDEYQGLAEREPVKVQ